MRFLTIIPARLASTRLPNKPLADICGKKMIQRVYEQSCKANLGQSYVACDSDEVKNLIENIGGKAILTDPDLPSGTDRIYQALQKIPNRDDFDFIVNLQGDLPIIDPEIIEKTANLIANSSFDIATIAVKIDNENDINDPNIVKVAIANLSKDGGKALYFSRSAIPHNKDGNFYEHIGIYVYKRSALEKFVQLEVSNLEKLEKLEQLRALENNMTIGVAIADSKPISIDTKSDLQKATEYLKNNEKS
ncbi:3-deoxy-manno-octulosonate cytidylyltransferase [Rickettsiales bacterium]|nr:3-deoxy-manno-octulosonate cytidylyltransferase [Rickettsiales bacterium]